jgi:hypothetical protein
MLIAFTGFSQETQVVDHTKNDIEKYKTTLIPAKFSTEFKEDKDKFDFKQLRIFLNERDALKKSLTSILDVNYVNVNAQNLNIKKVEALKDLIKGEKDDKEIDMRYYIYNEVSPPPIMKVKEISRVIKIIENDIEETKPKINTNKFLNENITNIKQDIQDCQNQIDTALYPENRKEEFKTKMSTFFIGLIGLILVCFFLIIYLRSDTSLSKDFLSGYGLQFITLFVLIIAIILFGILDILKGSELAAMLSGISGYILGKGIQDKKLITDSSIVDSKIPTTPLTVITDPVIPVIQANIKPAE